MHKVFLNTCHGVLFLVVFSGMWPRRMKVGITVKRSTRKSQSSLLQPSFFQLVLQANICSNISYLMLHSLLKTETHWPTVLQHTIVYSANIFGYFAFIMVSLLIIRLIYYHTVYFFTFDSYSLGTWTQWWRTYSMFKWCTCFVSRDGLEFHPASHKPDGEERRKCYSRLQASIQQSSSPGVLVQKQPIFHSHRSCDHAAQWRPLLPYVRVCNMCCVVFKKLISFCLVSLFLNICLF